MIQRAPERIIFIPFIGAFGGAERLLLDLSRYLHGIGVAHRLACFKQTIDLQLYADWPLQVHQLRPVRNWLTEARALFQFLRSTQRAGGGLPLLFDLKSAFYAGIASPGPYSLHLTDPPSLLPADISKYSSSARQHVKEFANLPAARGTRALRGELVHRLNRRGVRRAAKVIVMTDKTRKELHNLYGGEVSVLRPGVSSMPVKSMENCSASPLRMLSVSRLEANKRIDWILRALATLNSTGFLKKAEWSFEIAGDGAEVDSLKKLAQELGLAGHTFFLGHVSDQELVRAYSRAHLFIMPAVQGYGLPALEALRHGVPTIVHKDSGVSEILGGTLWSELVDGNNGSIATAIVTMVERLKNRSLFDSTLPRIPMTSEWAQAICLACGWVEASRN